MEGHQNAKRSTWNLVGAKLSREVRRIRAQGKKAFLGLRLSNRWKTDGSGLADRDYKDYETYLKHQALKLDAHRQKSIERHDRRFYSALRERLSNAPEDFAGRRVLCLAARQGTEVRAFIDEGAFAVGIDLNPGRGNRYVMVGDFHDLQFADATVDIVFTNSLDHAYDLARILSETKRVLTSEGQLICEVGLGTDQAGDPGFYEALSWRRVDDLVERISGHGFALDRKRRFDVPWAGEQLVFRRTSSTIQR